VNPPDLALFLPTLDGGGAERVMLDVATSAAAQGVRVELVLASRRGRYLDDVPEEVPIVDLGRERTVTALLPLARYLRRRRPRALLATLEHANVVALLAGIAAPGVPVSVREANTVTRDLQPDSARSRAVLWLMRRLYPRARAVIAVSQGVADELHRELAVPTERISVIANPVLTPRLQAGADAPLDHPWFADGAPPVVLGVGRLAAQKGFVDLLEAFALARPHTRCRLMILGEGDERAALEERARALGVAEDVALPGFVANPFAFMSRAAAFVLSSHWEGLPNVLIQAVALGTPVVATDCPSGPAEVLDGGRLGRLVPVGDPRAMADALLAALAAERQTPPTSWRARYQVDAVARQYLEAVGLR
jgi:glycosyltransferase involved in cell wall biosynthesis